MLPVALAAAQDAGTRCCYLYLYLLPIPIPATCTLSSIYIHIYSTASALNTPSASLPLLKPPQCYTYTAEEGVCLLYFLLFLLSPCTPLPALYLLSSPLLPPPANFLICVSSCVSVCLSLWLRRQKRKRACVFSRHFSYHHLAQVVNAAHIYIYGIYIHIQYVFTEYIYSIYEYSIYILNI